MKWLGLPVLAAFVILLVLAGFDLPHIGDPDAPASTHVAARYVERSAADTRTPNLVTAVLADYRGFDTLGEAVVVFSAALACACILLGAGREERRE
jgi:multicomponent Na+:H+ antiporter subunit B